MYHGQEQIQILFLKNNMTNYKILMMLLGGITLITFISYLFFYESKINNYYSCNELEDFSNKEYGCTITNKFIDKKNHSFRTISFSNCENLVLTNDTSGFYYFVKSNDKITKGKNTDTINVYREGHVFKFKIYFGCNKTAL